MHTTISPVQSIRGRLKVPGDKSISHRALMLAAIAEGQSRIEGLATGADVLSTKACMQQLGVEIEAAANALIVKGRGLAALHAPAQALDAGNSGTTMRLLSGILATRPFATTLIGDASLSRRPMRRIIAPLELMGAKVTATAEGKAPLTIHGGKLNSMQYRLPVASAQVKSCVLFAGLDAEGETIVIEPSATRDHSERMLAAMGAELRGEHNRIGIRRSTLHGMNISIPGDFSSAAFLIAAALLLSNSEAVLESVNVNPTRTAFLEVLKSMGATLALEGSNGPSFEPVATLHVQAQRLQGVRVNEALVPQLIDEVPILAVLATQAEGETIITGAQELRVKESDRLAALTTSLRAMGANVEELADGLIVRGPTRLHGAELDSFHDHRIAMAFAIAGLCADSPTTIQHAECADISFPGFFELLKEHCH
ncbi:3-phosphoshikimate 1-carboxyvinyltransferase [candidate division KSB1 bacterium]|nr:3-phosphoshikimate 1-carboxyvinyltransferase [candidate division KSB1 bacterium]